MAYYSFDIFDTLLSRKLATDRGILAAMKEVLRAEGGTVFPGYFIDDFIGLRKMAQLNAHAASKHPEVTLEEIYAAIGEEFPELRQEELRSLRETEEALELEFCYGISSNISRLLNLVEDGNTVVLISDMYLGKELICKMLGKVDPRLKQLPLYLSSDLRLRKMDGDLYRHVCKDLGIAPFELTHAGDSFHSDRVMAERCGVRSVHFRGSALDPVERSYFGEENNLFLQLVVGSSKQARLEGNDPKASYRLGAGYTGPLFYGTVHDTLKQAVKDGIRHVYFLARDGYLLKVIADEIVRSLAMPVEVHYLYVSRQSTYLASIFRLTSESFTWIFQEMDNVITFNRVAGRLQLEPDFFLNHLDTDLKDSIYVHGFDKRLKPFHIDALKSALLRDPLRGEVESNARDSRELVLGYFRQEGLLGNGRIGLVDIGWRGSLQDAMFRILKSADPRAAITSFYLAVTYFSQHTCSENRKIPAYMFPSTRAGIGPMLELLLQCDHGTTLRYRIAENGVYEPVLKTPPSHVDDWGVGSYKAGVKRFAENLSGLLKAFHGVETTYAAVTPILIELLEDALPEVANTLGDLHYCGDLEESHLRRFAPPISISEALRFLFGGDGMRSGLTQWFEVSYSRSHPVAKAVLILDPRRNFRRLGGSIVSRSKFLEITQDVRDFLRFHRARVMRR